MSDGVGARRASPAVDQETVGRIHPAPTDTILISLVCTVLNEGESIRPLMESLLAQTCIPDEILFVDGGSRDETVAILQGYTDRLPLRVIVEAGCNISAGRNRGIADARGTLICVTDAGVVLAREWVEALTTPMLDDPSVRVVSGWFEGAPQTPFEAALGATTLPHLREIKAETFLPSSRSVAFRKAVWAAVGGYPEWIDYCEDLIFDLRIKQVAGAFAFAPRAVAHFRPRPSLAAFYRQYYRYARGDGKADLWRKRHFIRYATYLLIAPLIVLLGLFVYPLLWLLFIPGAVVYFATPYRRLTENMRRQPHRSTGDWLYALVMVPVVRVVGDIAKMVGYPVGLAWRGRVRPPDWEQV